MYIYIYIHVYVHMYNIYRAVSKLFTVFPKAIECCRFTVVSRHKNSDGERTGSKFMLGQKLLMVLCNPMIAE